MVKGPLQPSHLAEDDPDSPSGAVSFDAVQDTRHTMAQHTLNICFEEVQEMPPEVRVALAELRSHVVAGNMDRHDPALKASRKVVGHWMMEQALHDRKITRGQRLEIASRVLFGKSGNQVEEEEGIQLSHLADIQRMDDPMARESSEAYRVLLRRKTEALRKVFPDPAVRRLLIELHLAEDHDRLAAFARIVRSAGEDGVVAVTEAGRGAEGVVMKVELASVRNTHARSAAQRLRDLLGDAPDTVAVKLEKPTTDMESASSLAREREMFEIAAALDVTPEFVDSDQDVTTALMMGFEEGCVTLLDAVKLRNAKRSTGADLARKIAKLHEKANMAHVDLKPGNVLVARDGRTRLIDFGMARIMPPSGVIEEDQALGTPAYMPPERLEYPSVIGKQGDVYALGCILFQMETGDLWVNRLQQVVTGLPGNANLMRIMQLSRDVRDDATLIDKGLEAVEPSLRPLLRRALDPDPANRPSASEMAQELELSLNA